MKFIHLRGVIKQVCYFVLTIQAMTKWHQMVGWLWWCCWFRV